MISKTVSDYLLERAANKLGCLPFEVPLRNSDVGFVYKVCTYSMKCHPVDWAEGGEPIYTESDLRWCVESVNNDLKLSS